MPHCHSNHGPLLECSEAHSEFQNSIPKITVKHFPLQFGLHKAGWIANRRANPDPGSWWSYMLPPCLSAVLDEGLLGKLLSVGVMAGLPTPDEPELLERCCWEGTGRVGLIAGGRSWALGNLAHSAGLNVLIIMVSAALEEELVPRLRAASGSRMAMVCEGLAGSELIGFFRGSSVSSTTSGACLAVFWRSSSRSSCRAVLIVFSMSCMIRKYTKTLILIKIACSILITRVNYYTNGVLKYLGFSI